jgi:hypothetical protein
MADNANTIADPAGRKFQDWFELYNDSDQMVHLGGYWLTDNLALTNMSLIPGGKFIGPRGFLLVWADEEPEQNAGTTNIHADFKLSLNGDSIGLFAPDGSLVDALSFGPMGPDESDGRWQDGADELFMMRPPTPNAPNRVLYIHSVLEPGAGAVAFAWTAVRGAVYLVEAATSLTETNWIPLGVVTALSDSVWISDTNAATATNRFYRVLELP